MAPALRIQNPNGLNSGSRAERSLRAKCWPDDEQIEFYSYIEYLLFLNCNGITSNIKSLIDDDFMHAQTPCSS